jgi:hypothetical protein
VYLLIECHGVLIKNLLNCNDVHLQKQTGLTYFLAARPNYFKKTLTKDNTRRIKFLNLGKDLFSPLTDAIHRPDEDGIGCQANLRRRILFSGIFFLSRLKKV